MAPPAAANFFPPQAELARKYADDDEEEDGQVGWHSGGAEDEAVVIKKKAAEAPAPAVPEVEASFGELQAVRIQRSTLLKWHDQPFFKDIVGCAVRVNIGPDPTTQTPIYRVALVEEIKDKPYAYTVDGITTNKQLVLSMAGSLKTFKFHAVSNKDFTQQEFDKWQRIMRQNAKPLPTQKWAQGKRLRVGCVSRHVSSIHTSHAGAPHGTAQPRVHARRGGGHDR